MFYTGLIHFHSGLRWLLLFLLFYSVIVSGFSLASAKSRGSNLMYRLTVMIAHLQLVAGFILYFVSPKVTFDPSLWKGELFRFYSVEHILIMIIAIVLITIGYAKAKKKTEFPVKYNRTIFTWYLIGLLLILAAIPWPFRGLGAGWF